MHDMLDKYMNLFKNSYLETDAGISKGKWLLL